MLICVFFSSFILTCLSIYRDTSIFSMFALEPYFKDLIYWQVCEVNPNISLCPTLCSKKVSYSNIGIGLEKK